MIKLSLLLPSSKPMTDSSFLPAGTVLENNYQIIKELGQGGFARTYLAANLRRFQENCVLKEFAPQIQENQVGKATEMFEREASIMYKLEHDQIPKFREQFKARTAAGESLFIVQDYIEGDNYWQLLQNRGQLFSEAEIAKFFQQILPVLGYVHQLGVVHRDISPDNIICRQSDSLPVLIDFGAVKEAAAKYSHVTGTVVGKVGFAPDEQMRRGQVSPASDLYALAATALVLMTGLEPHQLYDIRTASWEWERKVSAHPDLAQVINKMLAHRSKDRYQSAAEVLAALPPEQTLSKKSTLLAGAAPVQNLMSRLKTLIVSPPAPITRAVTREVTQAKPIEADWKKPVSAVAKFMGTIFLGTWAVTAGLKWLQNADLSQVAENVTSSAKSNDAPLSPKPNKSDDAAKSKDTSKPFDPAKSIEGVLPKDFDPMKSIGSVLPKNFDPMKSVNDAIPKNFDPLKSVNEAIASLMPNSISKPAMPIAAQQIQAKRKAVQKQLAASGTNADQFYKKVDQDFYQKHPELKNRQLKPGAVDSALRDEWWSIAGQKLQEK
jgi:serine/threonine protein kinase, bacterial